MADRLKQQCPTCAGRGVVPHQKRRMENGELDPADLRVHELCGKCGGGGIIDVDKATIAEKGQTA